MAKKQGEPLTKPTAPPWADEAAWIKAHPRPLPKQGAAKLKAWDDARRKYIVETLPNYKAALADYENKVREAGQPARVENPGTRGQILDPKTGEPIKFDAVPQSGTTTKGWSGFPAQTAAILGGMQAASVVGNLPYAGGGSPALVAPRTDKEIHRASIDEELRNMAVSRRMRDQMQADSEFRTKFNTDMEVEGEKRRAATIAALLAQEQQRQPPPRAVYNPERAAQTMPSYALRPMPSEQEMQARYAPRPMPSEEEMLAKYAPRPQPSEEELMRRYAVQDTLRNY